MDVERLKQIRSYMNDLKITASTTPVLTEGRFLKVAKAEYTIANSRVLVREEIVKRNNHAAIILPITQEGKIILVAQPRPLTTEGVTIETPAGYIDDGETGEQAAVRELLEETGYMPMHGLIYLGQYYQDQGCSRSINKSYLALGCKKVQDQKLDADELINYFECTYEETLELIEMGYMNSANSLLTIKLGEQKALDYIAGVNQKVLKRG